MQLYVSLLILLTSDAVRIQEYEDLFLNSADASRGWFQSWKFSLRVDGTQDREPYRIPLQFTSWEYNKGVGGTKVAPSEEDWISMDNWKMRCVAAESNGVNHEPVPAAKFQELSSGYHNLRSLITATEGNPNLIKFETEGYSNGARGELSPSTNYMVHCAVFEESNGKAKLKGSIVSVATRTADAPSFSLLTGVLDSGPPGLYPFQVGVALAQEQQRIEVSRVLQEKFKDATISCLVLGKESRPTRRQFAEKADRHATMKHEGGGFLLLDRSAYEGHLKEDSPYSVHCAVYRHIGTDGYGYGNNIVAGAVLSPVQSIEVRTGSIMPILRQPPRSASLFEVLLELEGFGVGTLGGEGRLVEVAELKKWVSDLQLRCASSLHELGKGSTSLQHDWVKLARNLKIDKYQYEPKARHIEFNAYGRNFTAKVGSNTKVKAGKIQREIEYLTGDSGYDSGKEFVEFIGDNGDADLSFLDGAGTLRFYDDDKDDIVNEATFAPMKRESQGWRITITIHGKEKQRLSPGTSYYAYCGLVDDPGYGTTHSVGSVFPLRVETALHVGFSLRPFMATSDTTGGDWELPYRVKAPVFDDVQVFYRDGSGVELGNWNARDRSSTADLTRSLEAQCVLLAGEVQVQGLPQDDLLKLLSSYAAAGKFLRQVVDRGDSNNANPVLFKMDAHFGPIMSGTEYTAACALVVDDDHRRRVAIVGEVKTMKLTAPSWGTVGFKMNTDFAQIYINNYVHRTHKETGTYDIGIWITDLHATGGRARSRGAKLDLMSPTEEGKKLCTSIQMKRWCLVHDDKKITPEDFIELVARSQGRPQWGTPGYSEHKYASSYDMCYKLYYANDGRKPLDDATTLDRVWHQPPKAYDSSIGDEESNYVSCAIVDGSPTKYWLASELHTERANKPATKKT